MVLADCSGVGGGSSVGHTRRCRSLYVPVAVTSLALSCLAAVVLFSAHQYGGSVRLLGHPDLLGEALDAEKTLNEGLTRLGHAPKTVQQTSLSKEMNEALKAVKELRGSLPAKAQAQNDVSTHAKQPEDKFQDADASYVLKHILREPKGSRGRAAHRRVHLKHSAAQDLVRRSLAKVRIAAQHEKVDSEIVGDLSSRDNRLVHNELRKMMETAKRLSGEIKNPSAKVPGSAQRAIERVQRKLGAVSHGAAAMSEVAGEEDAARQRVVAHELEVRKQKLAEAEEEELAAERAAKEAIAAERLAAKKHKEAAADEAAAHQRRAAAWRALEIAARGENGKMPKREVDKPVDSVFPQIRATTESTAGGKDKSKDGASFRVAQLESQCTETIATDGCGGLMANNPCLKFCGTDNAVRRAAHSRREHEGVKPVETGWAVHDRTGFFATGQGHETYVDTVYGDRSAEQRKEDRSAVLAAQSQSGSVAAAQEADAGEFADVAADGQDYEGVQQSEGLGQTQQVLRHEESLKRHLQGSLMEEEAVNRQLRERLSKQQSALRDLSSSLAFVSGIPFDSRGVGQSVDVLPDTPPLPRYAAVLGSQELAQVDERAAAHQAAGGVLLHDLSDANAHSSMHDPYRP